MGEHAGFGVLLRVRRRASGLSQEELASRAGLSSRAISKLESGKTQWPYPDSVTRLADALCLRDSERTEFLTAAARRFRAEVASLSPEADQTGVPRILPSLVSAFTGRADELKILSHMLGNPGGTTHITVITGTAGSGKTALAAHWAHQSADKFPDGQLFLNLHGFGPSGTPLTILDAVRLFLDALRVPPSRIPETMEAQLGLYRSLLAGKRMLIVLDNAHDALQVRSLLPSTPSCRIVVTSRNQLPSLIAIEAARPLTVTPLTADEAWQLLATRLGPVRLSTERRAVDQIIASCAGLPLALCIIAARAGLRPRMPLMRIAADFTGKRPLDTFADMSDLAADIRASFSWSYRKLDENSARTFRLLGLHPAIELEPSTVAAITDTTPEQAVRDLEALVRASMLQTTGAEHYTMNSLLRAYAREQAAQPGEDEDRPP